MVGRIRGMEDALLAIRQGADFYMVIASLVFKKVYEDVTKEERTGAKQKFWDMIYGRSKATLR